MGKTYTVLCTLLKGRVNGTVNVTEAEAGVEF